MKNIANRYTIDNSDTFDLLVAGDLKKVREFDYYMKKTQAPPSEKESDMKTNDGKLIGQNADLDLNGDRVIPENSETGISFLLV